MTQKVDELNSRFALDESLTFSQHASGLVVGTVTTKLCEGTFFLHGAHITSFRSIADPQPMLFLSSEALYHPDKAIRGGIPICFPWFGANSTDSSLPAHGYVRTAVWSVESTKFDDQAIIVTMRWTGDDFDLLYSIRFGVDLAFELKIANTSPHPVSYEIALHTYFHVSDITNVQVDGLESVEFLDQLTKSDFPASKKPICFTEETDRIYQGSVPQIVVKDRGYNRRILISPIGSASTVVWNPWIAKSQRMADFGDDEYLRMCCVETANVGVNRRTLLPRQSESVGAKLVLTNS